MTGTVMGYDPGGNDKHGVAFARVRDGSIVDVVTRTCRFVEEVIQFALDNERLLGIGVDTLTCWATGPSGLRPADEWLRRKYASQRNRVIASNSLYGSMSVNGMAFLFEVRERYPDVFMTETHPKVLYYALCREVYDYRGPNKTLMDNRLDEWLSARVAPQTGHEWDAAISTLAVVRGLDGSWPLDLHALSNVGHGRAIYPCGRTSFVWPE